MTVFLTILHAIGEFIVFTLVFIIKGVIHALIAILSALKWALL